MDRVMEEKVAGAEHHFKKKVYRSKAEEKDDSLIDFSAHIHGDNRFHHTRTHNLNKPRSGKAPRHGYHRPEKQAAGYAKKLDVLPSEIAKQVADLEGLENLENEQHLFDEPASSDRKCADDLVEAAAQGKNSTISSENSTTSLGSTDSLPSPK